MSTTDLRSEDGLRTLTLSELQGGEIDGCADELFDATTVLIFPNDLVPRHNLGNVLESKTVNYAVTTAPSPVMKDSLQLALNSETSAITLFGAYRLLQILRAIAGSASVLGTW
ncbi:uncharacterized protein LTHEOB_12866 [Lasiodiplodia theobromae]|uniref:uncharacterized protein n=1 Tax=Lasiodiplodia theobromae TaxID=45133 RepID=UPI0015C40BE8|nr:uncharacterized protein LTHEOB_12866 [Lasiodiplodia theobromae]KAF4534678.1 hypothetical protein LTHEOB_12866 [Lasiodiplodia theobromae]